MAASCTFWPGDEMMAVEISNSAGMIVAAPPRKLFTVPLNDISGSYVSPYDVSANGQRFLLKVPERPEPLFFLQGLGALARQRD
jgi:hypothetical protein